MAGRRHLGDGRHRTAPARLLRPLAAAGIQRRLDVRLVRRAAGGGRWRWLCVSLLVLAPLQRQIGLALIPAVMLGLLLFRRKTWTRADTTAAVAMWTLPAAIAYAAARLAVSHPLYSSLNVAALDVGHAIFPLVPMLGLGVIPYAAAR